MEEDHDPYGHLSDDYCTCPRCSGGGEIDCYCGGDLCVCDNYGNRPCPLCYGDGQISKATYEHYEAARRQHWADYLAAMSKAARKQRKQRMRNG